MRIEKVHTNNLRNDAHFQFHTEFRDLVLRRKAAYDLNFQALFDAYVSFYEREDDALKKIVKSALTEKIHDADKARDETFSGMTDIVRGMCKHYEPQTRDAALRVQVVLHTYGNIAQKPLNEQTSAIHNLVQELKSEKYGGDAESIGIYGWILELEKRNEALESLVKERYDAAESKVSIVVKEARGESDEAYRAIVRRINAFIEINGDEKYEAFVKTLNGIIAKYNVKKHHHLHHSSPEAEGEEDDDG